MTGRPQRAAAATVKPPARTRRLGGAAAGCGLGRGSVHTLVGRGAVRWAARGRGTEPGRGRRSGGPRGRTLIPIRLSISSSSFALPAPITDIPFNHGGGGSSRRCGAPAVPEGAGHTDDARCRRPPRH
uniref:Uncharacterized protein n=1 Tax=Zea mays TaxID=4577 RepID=A0A804LER9_MAIZE